MSSKDLRLWNQASEIDRTLKVCSQDLSLLAGKRIIPISYSRPQMFSRMVRGKISLFTNLKVPVNHSSQDNLRHALTKGIKLGFAKSRTARIQIGAERRYCQMRVAEVVAHWQRGRKILSVTDLHFRGTKFYEVVDSSRLSDFNVFCSDSRFTAEFQTAIEMMTLVISSKGNLTDNHADDCDGTNHCFVGRKLWLAWDRFEGQAKGFQDVDRDDVFTQAAFDLPTFLSLPSSRWFTVEPGQTLVLPGSFAHKVITLEPYIGIGSFHVALPSYVRSIRRWILHDTHDIGPQRFLGKINGAVIRRIQQLAKSTKSAQKCWGLSYVRKAIDLWLKTESAENKRALLADPRFVSFCGAAVEY
jgi:hypothetical protein